MATSERLSAATLDHIEALLGETTQGEWFWWMSEDPPFDIDVHGKGIRPYVAHVERIRDAEFIALAHQLVPLLLAEVRRLRALNPS
jgi:hypothetical protein